MARTTTARYTVEAEETVEAEALEFTEADAENLEFTLEDLEELEAESTENINLEDVNPESVAEALEGLMEAQAATGSRNGYPATSPSRAAQKELLKVFTSMVKQLVQKIMSSPKTRTKLQVATRKGPTAVAQLLTPIVAKELPSYLRWMAPLYVPAVTLALFDPIRQKAGVKPEEVEEAPEFFWALLRPLLKPLVKKAAKKVVKKAAPKVAPAIAKAGVKLAGKVAQYGQQQQR